MRVHGARVLRCACVAGGEKGVSRVQWPVSSGEPLPCRMCPACPVWRLPPLSSVLPLSPCTPGFPSALGCSVRSVIPEGEAVGWVEAAGGTARPGSGVWAWWRASWAAGPGWQGAVWEAGTTPRLTCNGDLAGPRVLALT